MSSNAGSCFGSPVKENFSVSIRYLELNALNEGELFTALVLLQIGLNRMFARALNGLEVVVILLESS